MQLQVANYINVQNRGKLGQDQATRAGYNQTCRQTNIVLNIDQPGWQILRLLSKPLILTSSRSSCFDSERLPNLSSIRIEYQLWPYVYNFINSGVYSHSLEGNLHPSWWYSHSWEGYSHSSVVYYIVKMATRILQRCTHILQMGTRILFRGAHTFFHILIYR